MKHFFLFNLYVFLLSIFGVSIIIFNSVRSEHIELSLKGMVNLWKSCMSYGYFGGTQGLKPVYDAWLAHISFLLGSFAISMAFQLYLSIIRNASMVDVKKALQSQELMTVRPRRSAKQAAALLFG